MLGTRLPVRPHRFLNSEVGLGVEGAGARRYWSGALIRRCFERVFARCWQSGHRAFEIRRERCAGCLLLITISTGA
jgi:hypothetical protein